MPLPSEKRDLPAPVSAPTRAEDLLDQAIELTFPASDPVSVVHAFSTATERDGRG
jgi:hypothetical protein